MTELSPPDDVRSAIRQLLVCLVKLALMGGDQTETRSWRSDALRAQRIVVQAADDTRKLNLDNLWTMAVKTAESDPVVRSGETANPMLPTMSPLGLAELETDPFDLDAAVQRIREATSFG